MGASDYGFYGRPTLYFQVFYSIWVIVDRLTESAHFLLVRSTFSFEQLARIYIQQIVQLHGVPLSIISNQGSKFTFIFLEGFSLRVRHLSRFEYNILSPY